MNAFYKEEAARDKRTEQMELEWMAWDLSHPWYEEREIQGPLRVHRAQEEARAAKEKQEKQEKQDARQRAATRQRAILAAAEEETAKYNAARRQQWQEEAAEERAKRAMGPHHYPAGLRAPWLEPEPHMPNPGPSWDSDGWVSPKVPVNP